MVAISGPPGAGKTTLGSELSKRLALPFVGRDLVKSGHVSALGLTEAPPQGGEVGTRAFRAFYELVDAHLRRRISVVCECTFRVGMAEADLGALAALAERVSIVHCRVEPAVSMARMAHRSSEHADRRIAHPDAKVLAEMRAGQWPWESYEPLSIGAPVLDVDTSDGYDPPIDAIVGWLRS